MNAWRERLVSAAVLQRLGELEGRDPEVRVLRLILGELKLYEWALSIGTLRDPVLRSLAPPLPPDALRRITADDAPETFLWTGLVDVEGMLGLCHQYGAGSERNEQALRPRLLDFGCGCGRLLRFLSGHGDLFELHGADVNPEHIQWCREFLAPIAFTNNAPEPPLPYPAGFFDCIWSLSVFTHLDQGRGAAWRAELARVLSPAGILIATTHGPTALARIAAESDLAARMRFDTERLRAVQLLTASAGFAFVPYEADALAPARAGEAYGLSFTFPEHLARHWADEQFALVAHLPGALRGWQDIVVLRKR